MRHRASLIVTLLLAAAPLAAQQSSPAAAAASPAAAAPRPIPPAAQQIAAAVLPLPDSMRAGARVLGYAADGSFGELKAGTGAMTCIADDPTDNRFHVACYHNSMEAYMVRGRELRAQHVQQPALDSIRKAEVLSGRIHLPNAAALYSLTGPLTSYDPATNTVHGARPLFVVYVPFATAESLGLPATPVGNSGKHWVMHSGEPSAHIMYAPEMP